MNIYIHESPYHIKHSCLKLSDNDDSYIISRSGTYVCFVFLDTSF